MSEALIEVHFYGGHADGATERFVTEAPKTYDFPTKSGDRHTKAGAFTRYRLSPAWSAHFGRPTMIPSDFNGAPPNHLQAA